MSSTFFPHLPVFQRQTGSPGCPNPRSSVPRFSLGYVIYNYVHHSTVIYAIHVCIYLYMYIHVYVCILICINIYTHIYIHVFHVPCYSKRTFKPDQTFFIEGDLKRWFDDDPPEPWLCLRLQESEWAFAVGRAVESPPYSWPAFASCFAWGSGELGDVRWRIDQPSSKAINLGRE